MAGTAIDALLAALGVGADPSSGRPGVSVSAPGQRLPGSGAVSPRGRQFVPTGPSPQEVKPGKPRGTRLTPIQRETPIPPTDPRSPQQSGRQLAAPEVGGGAGVDQGLLASLGLGQGFRNGLGDAAAGMAAGMGSDSFAEGFAKSLSGGMQSGNARTAAAAKQAREDADIARRQANEDRSFLAGERRADLADRRLALSEGRAEEDQNWQRQDREREEEERNSYPGKFLEAQKKAEDLTIAEKGKRADAPDPEAWDEAYRRNRARVAKNPRYGVAYGDATDEEPAVPRDVLKWGKTKEEQKAMLDEDMGIVPFYDGAQTNPDGKQRGVVQIDGQLFRKMKDPTGKQPYLLVPHVPEPVEAGGGGWFKGIF